MLNLFRPVGAYELAKILDAGCTNFPPRLPEQPIFYPVLDREYAEDIAYRWNPPDPNSGFVGFVTRFRVPAGAVADYPVKTVGAKRHQELWIPAERQSALLAEIDGVIEVIGAHTGSRLAEVLPGWSGSPGPVPTENLRALVELVGLGPLLGGPLTEG